MIMDTIREINEAGWPAWFALVIMLSPSVFTLGVFFFYVAKHVSKSK